MTLDELLTEARAILPGEKLFVMQTAGDNHGSPWSIHVQAFNGFDCPASETTPEKCLHRLEVYKLNRQVTLSDQLLKARENLRRLEALQESTTTKEGKS